MYLMEGFTHLHCDLGLQNTSSLRFNETSELEITWWHSFFFFLRFSSCLKFSFNGQFDMQTDAWFFS